LYKVGIQVTLAQVKDIVMAFAQGYADPQGQCQQTPPPGHIPNLVIVAGVSNSALRSGGPPPIWHDNLALTPAHGQAWSMMIDSIYDELKQKKLSPPISIASGYDSEYYALQNGDCRDPDNGRRGCNGYITQDADKWSVYSLQNQEIGTLHWALGYNTAQSSTNRLFNYDFGSCEFCKRTGSPDTWILTDLDVFKRIHQLTWGLNTSIPYPQIYLERYPFEWYNVRWYAHIVAGQSMIVYGAMTECGSSNCLDDNLPPRLEPKFDLACRSHLGLGLDCANPMGTPYPDWNPYDCGGDCKEFQPNLGSPNSPEGTPNPSISPQPGLPHGVTDIRCQIPSQCGP
jgi:hypothetical protein